MKDGYQTVIGLEIHVELSTNSKMFCRCSADYFNKEPNTHVCPVCLGLPGAMPVANKVAIESTIKIGKALNCSINPVSKFDRKHYFYPDLPKGYQISQYDEPIAVHGFLTVGEKKFRIHRVHLEEDTGKLIHKDSETLVDLNRAGVPLVEIVTEPDFDNPEDIKKFGELLQATIRTLKVSDADMEKGSMRLEPNISVRKPGQTGLPNYKVEVKNINSFNFAKKAIEYEVPRQIEILEKGETPAQETRGYNEGKGITVSQRSKEEAHDYRYFPEPDIPPLRFTDEYIQKIASTIPELPADKEGKYVKEYNLRPQDAFYLSMNHQASTVFESLIASVDGEKQLIANLIVNNKLGDIFQPVETLAAKAKEMLAPKKTDMGKLETVIAQVLSTNQKAVEDYKNGKQNSLMFLVGQVMRDMKGQADAQTVRKALEEKLK